MHIHLKVVMKIGWMQKIEVFLKEILKKKFAVLGVGSNLRGDDGVGPYISEKLSEYNSDSFLSINGDLVPENFTHDLSEFNPNCVLIIDAAFLEKSPGEVDLIKANAIKNVSFSFPFNAAFNPWKVPGAKNRGKYLHNGHTSEIT